MSEEQSKPVPTRAEVERYQEAIDYVNMLHCMPDFTNQNYVKYITVLLLAQSRVAELLRRAEAAEQDEIAWRGGP